MNRLRLSQRGFTIIELVIVIVVLGILAAIVIVAYNNVQQIARESRIAQQVGGARKLMETEYITNGKWPFDDAVQTMISEGDSSFANYTAVCDSVMNYLNSARLLSGQDKLRDLYVNYGSAGCQSSNGVDILTGVRPDGKIVFCLYTWVTPDGLDGTYYAITHSTARVQKYANSSALLADITNFCTP